LNEASHADDTLLPIALGDFVKFPCIAVIFPCIAVIEEDTAMDNDGKGRRKHRSNGHRHPVTTRQPTTPAFTGSPVPTLRQAPFDQ
jgi:hypothetical protein